MPPVHVASVRPVGQKATVHGEESEYIDRGQAVLASKSACGQEDEHGSEVGRQGFAGSMRGLYHGRAEGRQAWSCVPAEPPDLSHHVPSLPQAHAV